MVQQPDAPLTLLALSLSSTTGLRSGLLETDDLSEFNCGHFLLFSFSIFFYEETSISFSEERQVF